MSSPSAPAMAPSAAAPPPNWWGPNLSITFSAKTTLIYIGGSLGVLGVIMCFLMLTMILWVRPSRRRRLQALSRERHRLETLQEVKIEPDNFKPQVRAFPVVVVQPDNGELACGRKISLDQGSEAFEHRDIETGHTTLPSIASEGELAESSHSSRREDQSTKSQPADDAGTQEEDVSYNPLTHYLTGRQPHLFVAEIHR